MKAFSLSDNDTDDQGSASEDEPSYVVDGFKLEFSDKVALTPVSDARSPSAPR